MKKIILFVFSVWIMFLLPFIILSSHFMNSVRNISTTTTLFKIDVITSNISYQISSILENEYNIFFSFDKKTPTQKDLIEFLKKRKSNILRGFVVLDSNTNEIYNFNFGKIFNYNQIISNLKKIDMPIGIVEYPQDKPADLVVGKKIGSFYVLYRCDLGYLISKIMNSVSKLEGSFYLVDGDFNVIYDSLYDYLLDKSTVPKEIIELTKNIIKKSNFSYRGILQIGGKDYIVSIYNIENTSWWAYSLLELSQIDDPILYSWAKRVITIGVILMLIFSLFTYFFAKRIFKIS